MRAQNDKPEKGQVRSYKVQRVTKRDPRKQVAESNLFIRLPVDHLGVDKGDSVVASFDDAKIVVSQS